MVMCLLKFIKAGSDAALSQQEKNNSEDVQQGRVNTNGFICTVACQLSQRRTFDEFESLAVGSRRRWRMFQGLLRRLRLRHKKPRRVPPIGGPTGAEVWRHAWGDSARCPCAARHAAFNDKTSASCPLNECINA
jgi:hypothetical protein